MSFSLIVQNTYTTTHGGLYKGTHCIATTQNIDQASSSLILGLEKILKANNVSLNDISFIGAYQGPGPFTTLRVILASINGIAFAQNIPLVGLDGLDALLEEYTDAQFPVTVALLNAYNKDAYFGIQYHEKTVRKGYENIVALLECIQNEFPHQQIRFIGQGVDIFKENILKTFQDYAHFPSPLPEAPSLNMLAQKAYHLWQKGKTTQQLLPLYLKTLKYKKSTL